MSPEYILGFAIEPALDLLGPQFGSVDAERMLLAIGLQESRFLHRAQIGGPARGYWQFERGGVHGVLSHHESKAEAGKLCAALDYAPSEELVYGALVNNRTEARQVGEAWGQ